MGERTGIDKAFNWLGEAAVRLCAGGWEAVFVPSVGGAIISLRNAAAGADLLRSPGSGAALRETPQIYGLPLLLFPNRIGNGTFSAGGRTYRFPINEQGRNNHLHGFLHRKAFAVESAELVGADVSDEAAVSGETAAVLELSCVFGCGDSEFAWFPHPFRVTQAFRLSRRGLSHRIVVRNEGPERMPVGIGVHSNFRIPFAAGSGANDCSMRVSVGPRWELDGSMLPTGAFIPYDGLDGRIADDGFDPQSEPVISRCYTAGTMEHGGRRFNGAVIQDSRARMRTVYETDGAFKFWVIWNKDGKSGFVSMEPQSWVINAPNIGLPDGVTGMAMLEPGAEWQGECRLRIEGL